jgi:hypothetical protein
MGTTTKDEKFTVSYLEKPVLFYQSTSKRQKSKCEELRFKISHNFCPAISVNESAKIKTMFIHSLCGIKDNKQVP